jgi:hypothetical protein
MALQSRELSSMRRGERHRRPSSSYQLCEVEFEPSFGQLEQAVPNLGTSLPGFPSRAEEGKKRRFVPGNGLCDVLGNGFGQQRRRKISSTSKHPELPAISAFRNPVRAPQTRNGRKRLITSVRELLDDLPSHLSDPLGRDRRLKGR